MKLSKKEFLEGLDIKILCFKRKQKLAELTKQYVDGILELRGVNNKSLLYAGIDGSLIGNQHNTIYKYSTLLHVQAIQNSFKKYLLLLENNVSVEPDFFDMLYDSYIELNDDFTVFEPGAMTEYKTILSSRMNKLCYNSGMSYCALYNIDNGNKIVQRMMRSIDACEREFLHSIGGSYSNEKSKFDIYPRLGGEYASTGYASVIPYNQEWSGFTNECDAKSLFFLLKHNLTYGLVTKSFIQNAIDGRLYKSSNDLINSFRNGEKTNKNVSEDMLWSVECKRKHFGGLDVEPIFFDISFITKHITETLQAGVHKSGISQHDTFTDCDFLGFNKRSKSFYIDGIEYFFLRKKCEIGSNQVTHVLCYGFNDNYNTFCDVFHVDNDKSCYITNILSHSNDSITVSLSDGGVAVIKSPVMF